MSFTDAIAAHWGDPPPGWVVLLAAAADAQGLAATGRQLGYAKASLSLALRNAYPGGTSRLAAAVSAVLAPATPTTPVLHCPVLGTVSPARCAEGRRVAAASHSLLAGLLRLGCPSCPHATPSTDPTGDAP